MQLGGAASANPPMALITCVTVTLGVGASGRPTHPLGRRADHVNHFPRGFIGSDRQTAPHGSRPHGLTDGALTGVQVPAALATLERVDSSAGSSE